MASTTSFVALEPDVVAVSVAGGEWDVFAFFFFFNKPDTNEIIINEILSGTRAVALTCRHSASNRVDNLATLFKELEVVEATLTACGRFFFFPVLVDSKLTLECLNLGFPSFISCLLSVRFRFQISSDSNGNVNRYNF